MENGGNARRLECLESRSCRFKIKVSTEQIPSNSHPDPVPQRPENLDSGEDDADN